jgi:hypothetical protein
MHHAVLAAMLSTLALVGGCHGAPSGEAMTS